MQATILEGRRRCALLVRSSCRVAAAKPRHPSSSAVLFLRRTKTGTSSTNPTPRQSPTSHGSHGHTHVPEPNRPMAKSIPKKPPSEPTRQQLRYHFYWEMVPMIAFGFMDQTILIQAGNAIDCSLGVMFGLSTLTAAAFGSICSMFIGLLTGGTVERAANHIGLPHSGLTSAQRALPRVQRVGLYGTLAGAMLGCTLGMVNLLLVDTSRSETLKLQALTQDQEFAFEVEASNAGRSDATTLTVRGPDVDGTLASMTAALTASGFSLVELHASPRPDQDIPGGILTSGDDGFLEDVFIVRPRGTKGQVPDDELDDLARGVLAACKDPLSAHSLKSQVIDLEADNDTLSERVALLERMLEEKQVKIERHQSSSSEEE